MSDLLVSRSDLFHEMRKRWRASHDGPDDTWMVEVEDTQGNWDRVMLSWPTEAQAFSWIDRVLSYCLESFALGHVVVVDGHLVDTDPLALERRSSGKEFAWERI